MKTYKHLTLKQRYQISADKKSGWTNEAIAKELGVDTSTVGRELRRNRSKRGYRPKFADEQARKRKQTKATKRISPATWARVDEKLNQEWSPEQIHGWLKKEGAETVSHERIYQHIAEDKTEGGELYLKLRCQKKKRSRYGKYSKRGVWKDIKRIDEREAIVEQKTRVGDWEPDNIIGKGHQGAIVIMVERRSKLLRMRKVAQKNGGINQNCDCQRIS